MDSIIAPVLILLGFEYATLISASFEITVSGKDGDSFSQGSVAILTCIISPYTGIQTWKVNDVSVADCGFVVCAENTSNPDRYSFSPNISAETFIFTINPVEYADNGSAIDCFDGSNTKTFSLVVSVADQTPPSSDKGISVGVYFGIILGIMVVLALIACLIFCVCKQKKKKEKKKKEEEKKKKKEEEEKKKKKEKEEKEMSQAETAKIFRAYQTNPTNLDKMIKYVQCKAQEISQQALELYKKLTKQEIEYRICSRLYEVLTSDANKIEDTGMRDDVLFAKNPFANRSDSMRYQFNERLHGNGIQLAQASFDHVHFPPDQFKKILPNIVQVEMVIEMKNVGMSKNETLLILSAYRNHPNDLDAIIADVQGKVHQFSQIEKDLYKKLTKREVEYRICSRLYELLTSEIEETEMSNEIHLAQTSFDEHVHFPPYTYKERLQGIVHGAMVIKVNKVDVIKEQALLILKAYKKYPTDSGSIIAEVQTGKVQRITQIAMQLCKQLTEMDQEYITFILNQLLTSDASKIVDTKIREEVQLAQHFRNQAPPHNGFRNTREHSTRKLKQ